MRLTSCFDITCQFVVVTSLVWENGAVQKIAALHIWCCQSLVYRNLRFQFGIITNVEVDWPIIIAFNRFVMEHLFVKWLNLTTFTWFSQTFAQTHRPWRVPRGKRLPVPEPQTTTNKHKKLTTPRHSIQSICLQVGFSTIMDEILVNQTIYPSINHSNHQFVTPEFQCFF